MKQLFVSCLQGLLLAACTVLVPAQAQAPAPTMGIVVMHGKGGSPNRWVNELASALATHGYLVANLEMPWSGRRDYDVPLEAAEQEVQAAISGLQAKGARKIFVAGHSQGGMFALYFASRHPLDGVIAIAPGGDPTISGPKEKLSDSVELARKLIGEGKGNDKVRLSDYEGSKGVYPLITTPTVYMSWFDPDGEFGVMRPVRHMPATLPVLYIAPTGDYPGLAKAKAAIFGALPPNPLTQLYEPSATHLGAPSASIAKVMEWTAAVSVAQ